MFDDILSYDEMSPTFLVWKITTSRKSKAGFPAGGIHKKLGYGRFRYRGQLYYIHRVVWELHNGPLLEGQMIDHINGIRSDNRLENLRIATVTQNNQNTTKRSFGKSKYKGVSWHKQCGKWRSELTVDKKRIHIGLFELEEEAAKAYNKEAVKVFGEFAKINHF